MFSFCLLVSLYPAGDPICPAYIYIHKWNSHVSETMEIVIIFIFVLNCQSGSIDKKTLSNSWVSFHLLLSPLFLFTHALCVWCVCVPPIRSLSHLLTQWTIYCVIMFISYLLLEDPFPHQHSRKIYLQHANPGIKLHLFSFTLFKLNCCHMSELRLCMCARCLLAQHR